MIRPWYIFAIGILLTCAADGMEEERIVGVDHNDPTVLLLRAITDHDCRIAELAIQNGADVTTANNEPLRRAVRLSDTLMTRLLLAHGADPNVIDGQKGLLAQTVCGDNSHQALARLFYVYGGQFTAPISDQIAAALLRAPLELQRRSGRQVDMRPQIRFIRELFFGSRLVARSAEGDAMQVREILLQSTCQPKERALALTAAAGRGHAGCVNALLAARSDPGNAYKVVSGILKRPNIVNDREQFRLYQAIREKLEVPKNIAMVNKLAKEKIDLVSLYQLGRVPAELRILLLRFIAKGNPPLFEVDDEDDFVRIIDNQDDQPNNELSVATKTDAEIDNEITELEPCDICLQRPEQELELSRRKYTRMDFFMDKFMRPVGGISGNDRSIPADSDDQTDPMRQALENHDSQMVQVLLQEGIDSNDYDTLLQYAVGHNNLIITRQLLDRGADPNAKERSGKVFARKMLKGRSCSLSMRRLLCMYGSCIDGAAIDFAELFKRNDLVVHAARGDVQEVTDILNMSRSNPNALSDKDKILALAMAAGRGKVECVRVLLKENINPMDAFKVVLGILRRKSAENSGNFRVIRDYMQIKEMLKIPVWAVCSVNSRGGHASLRPCDANTAFRLRLFIGNEDIDSAWPYDRFLDEYSPERLIEEECQNIQDTLEWAVENNNLGKAQDALERRGEKARPHSSLYECAMKNRNIAMVHMLLAHGCTPQNILDHEYGTRAMPPVNYALVIGRRDLARLCVLYGEAAASYDPITFPEPLVRAVIQKDREEIVKLFKNNRATKKTIQTALAYAAGTGHSDIVGMLLSERRKRLLEERNAGRLGANDRPERVFNLDDAFNVAFGFFQREQSDKKRYEEILDLLTKARSEEF